MHTIILSVIYPRMVLGNHGLSQYFVYKHAHWNHLAEGSFILMKYGSKQSICG